MSGKSKSTGFNCKVLVLAEVTVVGCFAKKLTLKKKQKSTNFYPSQNFCCAVFVFVRCGSGLSGDYLSEEGHYWVGVDISTAMLGESNHETRVKVLIL